MKPIYVADSNEDEDEDEDEEEDEEVVPRSRKSQKRLVVHALLRHTRCSLDFIHRSKRRASSSAATEVPAHDDEENEEEEVDEIL